MIWRAAVATRAWVAATALAPPSPAQPATYGKLSSEERVSQHRLFAARSCCAGGASEPEVIEPVAAPTAKAATASAGTAETSVSALKGRRPRRAEITKQ